MACLTQTGVSRFTQPGSVQSLKGRAGPNSSRHAMSCRSEIRAGPQRGRDLYDAVYIHHCCFEMRAGSTARARALPVDKGPRSSDSKPSSCQLSVHTGQTCPAYPSAHDSQDIDLRDWAINIPAVALNSGMRGGTPTPTVGEGVKDCTHHLLSA